MGDQISGYVTACKRQDDPTAGGEHSPPELKILLYRLNLRLPNRLKIMENVVQTLGA